LSIPNPLIYSTNLKYLSVTTFIVIRIKMHPKKESIGAFWVIAAAEKAPMYKVNAKSQTQDGIFFI
jgi:hypothetical protein